MLLGQKSARLAARCVTNIRRITGTQLLLSKNTSLKHYEIGLGAA